MIKKLFGGLTALALVAGFFAFNTAQATHPEYDLSGTHEINFIYMGSDNPHVVTLAQEADGDLSGSGSSGAYTYTINSGDVSGNSFNYTAVYTGTPDATGTIFNVTGTVDETDGSLDGTWTDNYAGGSRAGTFSSDADSAEEIDDEATETYLVEGSGNIGYNGSNKGKKMFTFELSATGDNSTDDDDETEGTFTWVDHRASKGAKSCTYDISNLVVTGDMATFIGTSTKAGCTSPITVKVEDNGTPGKNIDAITVNGTRYVITGGDIEIDMMEVDSDEEEMTFSGNSTYYNCPTTCADVYSTGPISFTWDDDGMVTSGTYTATRNGTTYYNNITGGTVMDDGAVTLNFSRTTPNTDEFSFTGTLVGDMLTGNLDGPYYFTANDTD